MNDRPQGFRGPVAAALLGCALTLLGGWLIPGRSAAQGFAGRAP